MTLVHAKPARDHHETRAGLARYHIHLNAHILLQEGKITEDEYEMMKRIVGWTE